MVGTGNVCPASSDDWPRASHGSAPLAGVRIVKTGYDEGIGSTGSAIKCETRLPNRQKSSLPRVNVSKLDKS